MKRIYLMLLVAMATLITHAAAPSNYYQSANGKKGEALKTALYNIIKSPNTVSYNGLWDAFKTTDVRSDGKIWDMYSGISNYTPGTDQAGSYDKEGDCYNREHSFPKSWFGGDVTPMYTDLFHLYPTDGYVNGRRSNHPFGETNGNTYTSSGGFSKLGSCTVSGYSGTVFEPNDEYKGDFARTYFYMVTCYENLIVSWYNKTNADAGVKATLNGTTYPGFQIWQLNMLLRWAEEDPVSAKETARNDKVYGKQGNRNPFIDYPGLEQYIWGSKKDDTFSYDNYVEPTEYTGYNEGGGQGQGGETPSGEGGTYKLTITVDDFVTGGYAANNSEKTSQAVCTTDISKTYEVKWTSYQVANQNNIIQWKKEEGYIYNSTDLGTISSVTITSSEGSFTTYYGTSPQPSSSTTVGGGYFKTCVGNVTGKSSKIEVIFTIPDPTPVTKDDPSFNLANLNVDYGSTLTLTQGTTGTPNIVTDGTVTITSSNDAVCTVNGLTITPVAVGTAIITINTAASTNYNAGSTMAEITVNAPQGKTTAMPSTGGETNILLFGESFGDNSGSARAWNDSYSVKSGVSDVYSGITGYIVTNAKQGKNTTGSTLSGLNQTTSGTDASIIIGPLNVANYENLNLTYQWKAGSIKGTYSTSAYYATSANGNYTALTGTGEGATSFVERSYSLPSAAQVATLYLKIIWNTSNTGAVIDEVQLRGSSTGTSASISVKLNSSGYATFCSEYPLDFTNAEGYSAWQITGVNGTTINFSQITGRVKGGTGILLKGEGNATITLSSADSSNELTSNLLYGTLAPTYVSADEYYGLSGTKFVKVNAGTVKAGKALLPTSMVGEVSDVKALAFVFEETDQIESLTTPSPMGEKRIFNLAGQRLSKPQKGVNIINGKKVIIK